MLPYFLFPHAIVWLRMAFLTMFWQQPTPGPVPRRFRFCLSSGLLFKRVPSFSRPFYPLPCTEVLLLWTELMKRSDSGQHSAPRTRVSRDSQGTTVTMHHRALRRGPARRQEKDQPHRAAKAHAPSPPLLGVLCGQVCFIFRVKPHSAIAPLPTSSCERTG